MTSIVTVTKRNGCNAFWLFCLDNGTFSPKDATPYWDALPPEAKMYYKTEAAKLWWQGEFPCRRQRCTRWLWRSELFFFFEVLFFF